MAGVRYELPDGRVLLEDVSFRVGEGAKVALVGANGAGKTTLLRIITADLVPHAGAVTRSGGLGVMRQMVGLGSTTVAELLMSVSPPRVRTAAAEVDRLELALMEVDDEPTQMAYATALSEFADAGGYEIEVVWDTCCTAALGVSFDKAKYRELTTLSGGEQKRLVLEYLLAGPDQVLLLDEPDNFLDVPGKIWLESRIRESSKTILFISHDRELLDNTATRVVTVELASGGQSAGNTVWTHPGWVHVVPPGPQGPVRALRGAAAPLGRGACQAQGAGAAAEDQGGVQRRHVQPVPRGPDPAAQVRGGRPTRPSSRASSRSRCGSRAVGPASVPWSARTSS